MKKRIRASQEVRENLDSLLVLSLRAWRIVRVAVVAAATEATFPDDLSLQSLPEASSQSLFSLSADVPVDRRPQFTVDVPIVKSRTLYRS